MTIALGMNHRVRVSECREIDDQFSRVNVGLHGDRIAPASIANRRGVNRRAAIPAHDVLSVLPVSSSAADLAGIERRGVVSIDLMNYQKADQWKLQIGRAHV